MVVRIDMFRKKKIIAKIKQFFFFFSSLDAYFNNNGKDESVPNWNYFILKFQIFILYFYAGLKKTDMEWLDGYSMTDLGKHWVFEPFK